MRFLKNLFKKAHGINDDFFGNMIYMEVKEKYGNSYFECQRNFSPSNKIIEIGIDADIQGPTNLQKEFFEYIESNYSKITESIIPLIEDQFRNWKPDFEIKNFNDEFQPEYLKISKCEEQPIIWNISFSSWHDENHYFEVTMNDFQAIDLLIDG